MPSTFPAWPATLPAPQANSYKETPQSNLLRTEMAAGPAKVRLKSTWAGRLLDVTWIFNDEQLDTFITFHDDTLLFGIKAFTAFPKPRSGLDTATLYPVRFVTTSGGYTLTYSDNFQAWQVTAQLEVLPASYAND